MQIRGIWTNCGFFSPHFIVSRVINLQGPQTQITVPTKLKEEKTEDVLPGVEERLCNIEEHLKLKTGKI
jgi:hypothetical protein